MRTTLGGLNKLCFRLEKGGNTIEKEVHVKKPIKTLHTNIGKYIPVFQGTHRFVSLPTCIIYIFNL